MRLVPARLSIRLRQVLLAALIALPVASFQNCSNVKTGGGDSSSNPQFSGNGGPYEGKTFISAELCADKTPAIRIHVSTKSSAQVLRENCQDVTPAREITDSEFTVNEAPVEIVYKNQTLHPEVPIFFKQAGGSGAWPDGVGSSLIYTVPSVTQGNLLVCGVVIWSYAPQAPNPVVTDASGDVVKAATPFAPLIFAPNSSTGVFYVENASGGSHTIQVTDTTWTGAEINCAEYSGIAKSGALLSSAHSSGTTPVNVGIGPVTTPIGNNLILTVLFSQGWYDAGPGISIAYKGVYHSFTFAEQITNTPGTYTAPFVPSGAFNDGWDGTSIVFKGE